MVRRRWPTRPRRDRYPGTVQFVQPEGSGTSTGPSGTIDYRLDRRRTLRAYRKGELDRAEICDAQLELMRVANDCSEAARTACPVCEERTLRLVRYVFGPRLPRGGRCVSSEAELRRLAARPGEYRCYLVEVCRRCRWNHLLSTFLLRPLRSA